MLIMTAASNVPGTPEGGSGGGVGPTPNTAGGTKMPGGGTGSPGPQPVENPEDDEVVAGTAAAADDDVDAWKVKLKHNE